MREIFITLHTFIRLQPGMCPFVYFELIKCCEHLVTLLTGEVHGGQWLGADWGSKWDSQNSLLFRFVKRESEDNIRILNHCNK